MEQPDASRYSIWSCQACAVEKPGTAHQKRQTFCSVTCYAANKKNFITGKLNPNYRGGCEKTCLSCKSTFKSYVKSRKFCSTKCYWDTKGKDKTQVAPKQKQTANYKTCVYCSSNFKCAKSIKKITCSQKCSVLFRENKVKVNTSCCLRCGQSFISYPSSQRKYCSYKCHLDNGGAFKAGLAAAKATMKYGPKRDANHAELFSILRKYCAVYDVSTSGMGIPDGLAWINGAWHLFDIKNPKTGYGKRGLNAIQKKWLSQAQGGPIYLLYTAEEAELFATGKFDGLKFELPET